MDSIANQKFPFQSNNPCVSCGACCAFFRVAFYWRESEQGTDGWKVPKNFTMDLDNLSQCMKGTEVKHRPKCIALKGKIGAQALCEIYSQRPSPCRNFQASYFKGIKNPRCDEARKAHGLPPLRREDWSFPTSPRTLESP